MIPAPAWIRVVVGGLHFTWLAALLPLTLLNLKSHGLLPPGSGFTLWLYLTGCLPLIFLFYFDAAVFPETISGLIFSTGGILSNVLLVLSTPGGQIFTSANTTLFLYQAAQLLAMLAFTGFFLASHLFPIRWSETLQRKTSWTAFTSFRDALPGWYILALLGFLGVTFYYLRLFSLPVIPEFQTLPVWWMKGLAVAFGVWQIAANFRPFYLMSISGKGDEKKTESRWVLPAMLFLVVSVVVSLFVFLEK